MGNRRVSRKRLYQIEKAGQTIELDSGPGISGAVKSASQHRNGQEIITEIALDLSPSSGVVIKNGGADTQAIGVNAGGNAFITQLTIAKYGIVTEIRGVLVEDANAGGARDINVAIGSDEVARGTAPANHAPLASALDALGRDSSLDLDDAVTYQGSGSEYYLYLTADSSNSDDFSAGKVLIYIHGFEPPADL